MDSKPKHGVFVTVLLPVLLCALSVRAVFLWLWLGSPLRYYHLVDGLDMKTLLEMGRLFFKGGVEFSFFNLMTASSLFFCGESAAPLCVVVLHLLMGAVAPALVAWCSLAMGWGRFAALLSGLTASLYAPELLYEGTVLKETMFVFFAVLSLSAVIRAWKSGFHSAWMVVGGAALALPSQVRFAGFLWLLLGAAWVLSALALELRRRDASNVFRRAVRPLCFLFGGIFAVLLPASVFNCWATGLFRPFLANTAYYLGVGSVVDAASLSLPGEGAARPLSESVMWHLKKLLSSFSCGEIPNNLNFDFMVGLVEILKYLPGPMFLIPAAISGLAVMLVTRRFWGVESVLPVFLVSYVVPLTMFVPLGRYRLVLAPVFCMLMAWFFDFILRTLRRRESRRLLAGLFLYALTAALAAPGDVVLRADDFVSLGLALEHKAGPLNEQSRNCFKMASMLNPASKSAAVNCSAALHAENNFAGAKKVLEPFVKNGRAPDFKVAMNYAISCNNCGEPALAEAVLASQPEPLERPRKASYFFTLGESRRLQGKNAQAGADYARALQNADNERLRQLIRARMSQAGQVPAL